MATADLTTDLTTEPTSVLDLVRVTHVERLSPGFVRLELTGPALAELGVDGPWWDQRIKLVVPEPGGSVPPVVGPQEEWYVDWVARPPAERGHLRTYTVRRTVGTGADTRLVVDVVLHEPDPVHGLGPGAAWAAAAAPGDEVVLWAPRRGHAWGGIEWAPGDADELLLVGDETALPAIASVLETLPPDARGAAYVEVPVTADVQDLVAPDGVRVTWLVRDDAPHGERLHAAVVAHLGGSSATSEVSDEDVDPDLWETPAWSSSGEAVPPSVDDPRRSTGFDGLYAWIAGEAKVVTGLRRALVRDLGIDRSQVAFMGYWRQGVAMRS